MDLSRHRASGCLCTHISATLSVTWQFMSVLSWNPNNSLRRPQLFFLFKILTYQKVEIVQWTHIYSSLEFTKCGDVCFISKMMYSFSLPVLFENKFQHDPSALPPARLPGKNVEMASVRARGHRETAERQDWKAELWGSCNMP